MLPAEEAFRWLRGVICSHEGLALSQVLGATALKDPTADQLVALLTTIYRALSAAGSPLAGAVPSLWHDAAVRMLRCSYGHHDVREVGFALVRRRWRWRR